MERVAPVRVAEARPGRVVETIDAVGSTRARRSVAIVATVSGRLVEIAGKQGEPVSAGTVLFRLESDRERAEVREAEAVLNGARQQYDRARALVGRGTVAQARVDELTAELRAAEARLASARARLADREIRAPFDGVLGLRDLSIGSFVSPEQRLTTLDDLAFLELEFTVPERFLSQIRPGLRVEAATAAVPGRTFEGTVGQVDTRIDPASRTLRIRADLPNPDHLPQGLFMTVTIALRERDDALLVPLAALITEGRENYVFRLEGGVARRAPVEVGQREGESVEITHGLAAGDQVVVEGQQRLREGMRVELVPAKTS